MFRNPYIKSKIVLYLKEHYFRNDIKGKNPVNRNDLELLSYIEKNNIDRETINLAASLDIRLDKLDSDIRFHLPRKVKKILEHLMTFSKNTYLVGGCVRDSILGNKVKDWDFVTDIPYSKLHTVMEQYDGSVFKAKETGKQFLVFNMSDGTDEFEIANFRKDGTYVDGRRPETVEIGDIYDDAQRRDFTVNALYWNTDKGLVAPSHQSLDDIIDGTLRFVGNPKDRLNEDYLRGWRFYRFVATKGLTPDKKSLKAVREHFDKLMECDSMRVMNELEKIAL